jgi:hypothetical protein
MEEFTVEKLQERLSGLKAGFENTQQQIGQLERNLHATSGAIQECEYWIKVLSEKSLEE